MREQKDQGICPDCGREKIRATTRMMYGQTVKVEAICCRKQQTRERARRWNQTPEARRAAVSAWAESRMASR